jgi:hypothetical protein
MCSILRVRIGWTAPTLTCAAEVTSFAGFPACNTFMRNADTRSATPAPTIAGEVNEGTTSRGMHTQRKHRPKDTLVFCGIWPICLIRRNATRIQLLRGRRIMVIPKLPKLEPWVRFPSPAPLLKQRQATQGYKIGVKTLILWESVGNTRRFVGGLVSRGVPTQPQHSHVQSRAVISKIICVIPTLSASRRS